MAKIMTGKKKIRKKEKEEENKLLPEARDQPAQELWLQALEGETMSNNKQAATSWARSSSQVDCKTQPRIYFYRDKKHVYFYFLAKDGWPQTSK